MRSALHGNDSNLRDALMHYRPVWLKICCVLKHIYALSALHENDSNLRDVLMHYRPVQLKICCVLKHIYKELHV